MQVAVLSVLRSASAAIQTARHSGKINRAVGCLPGDPCQRRRKENRLTVNRRIIVRRDYGTGCDLVDHLRRSHWRRRNWQVIGVAARLYSSDIGVRPPLRALYGQVAALFVIPSCVNGWPAQIFVAASKKPTVPVG